MSSEINGSRPLFQLPDGSYAHPVVNLTIRDGHSLVESGHFEKAALATVDTSKADRFADSIAKAAVGNIKIPSPRVVAPIAAAALLTLTASINFLVNRFPTATAASPEVAMINPLEADTSCTDHPRRPPQISSNHIDLKIRLPREADTDAIIRIIESSTQQTAEAPISEVLKLGTANIETVNQGTPAEYSQLEVHNYLPRFKNGERQLEEKIYGGKSYAVPNDLVIKPNNAYTVAVEYNEPAQLFVNSQIQTNGCNP